jgi:hypothetical protein
MAGKKILRPEMAFVILWDPDKETIVVQRKDGTYGVEPFRLKHCFIGTGVRREKGENPVSSLQRKLVDEMTDAQQAITSEMRFWKKFHLRWGKSIVEKEYAGEEGYACHVFIRMLENQYEMTRLVDDIRGRGKKRATLMHMPLDQFKRLQPQEFMGSLHIVAEEFLEKIERGSERFWESLEEGQE